MNDISTASLSVACMDGCKEPSIRLSGQLLSPTGALNDLRVEAWDQAKRIVDLVACAFTNAYGAFELVFPAETLRVFFGDQRPTLFFRVFRGPDILADTDASLTWELDDAPSSPLSIRLPPISPDTRLSPAPFTVRGQIRNVAGTPLVGLVVRAFDRNLRDRETELLLHGTTDAVGHYSIAYAIEELGRPGKHQADLVLRVFAADGSPLGATDSRCQAPAALVLDLLVEAESHRGPSELEILTARLLPLLPVGVATVDLTDDDIAFLTCSAGLDAEQLAALIAAERLAHALDLPVALLYGLARAGLPLVLSALITRTPEERAAAFDEALAEHIIPSSLRAQRTALLASLEAALFRAYAEQPVTPGKPSFDALFATVLASPASRDQLLALQLAHQGSAEELWAKLEVHPDFSYAAPALAFTSTVATITDNHLPLIEALQAARQAGTISVARDLATLSAAGWSDLIERAGVPSDAPGTDADDKARRYMEALQARVEEAFPSAFFAAKLVVEERSEEQELAKFLKSNPDFDLGTSRLDEYLAGAGVGAASGISDLPGLRLLLGQTQRIFKLTPRYSEGRSLLDAGLTSAQHVVRMGRERLIGQLAERLGGEDNATAIHARAAHVVAASMTLYAQHHASMNAVSLRVLPTASTTGVVPQASDLRSDGLALQTQALSVNAPALFTTNGSEHRTLESGVDFPLGVVLAPPAISTSLATLADLFGGLSFCACDQCRSVHGAAAYLVELLSFLEPHTSVLFGRRPDLGRIELSCDNTNTPLPYIDLVNEVLERAVAGGVTTTWPQTTWTAAELAVSPEHVTPAAYTKLAASTTVYPWNLPFDLGLEQSRVFLTHLGVARQALLATLGSAGTDPKAIAAEILGLSPSAWSIVAGTDTNNEKAFWGTVPAGGWPSPSWHVALAPLPELLRRAGLSYTDLTAVLAARFVNWDASLAIAPDTDSSALEDRHVTNLQPASLDRIHRFVRLQRQLGWTPVVLDQALVALSAPNAAPSLSEATLLQLASVQQLSVDLAQSVASLLPLWGLLDTAPGEGNVPSLYAHLFQNPAVIQSSASGDAFALNAQKSELVHPPTVTSVLPSLLAALRISAADLSLLTDSAVAERVLHVPSAVVSSSALTLADLSQLYRHVTLARALHLSIRELLTLRILSGLDPFDRQHVDTTRRFVELAAKVQTSGFKVAELDYLLRDVQPSPGTIGMNPSTVTQLVDAIQKGLQALSTDPSVTPIDAEALRASRLQLLKEKLSPALKLDSVITGLLLTTLITSSAAPARSSFDELCRLVDATASVTAAEQTVVRLSKAALLVQRFKFTADELDFRQDTDRLPWLVAHAPTLGWLDLSSLPPKQDAALTPSLLAWERVLDYVTLRSRLPEGTPLLALFHASTPSLRAPYVLKNIADRTGFALADLVELASTWGLSVAAGSYQDERMLVRFQSALEVIRRLGVPATQATAWANASAGPSDLLAASGEIRKSAKAKYDDATWSGIARPLQNALRAKQRSALVASLLGKGTYRDENALFESFLLDTQVTPCVMTSRIKQAIGSVQLFIQRALMHLEPHASLTPEAAQLWTWMKTYRVWEAARKIFLYPENWILPELRDDKTPFFKELEQDLKKHDVTAEIAEQAFRRYVEKLDEVARLEVVGMYHEVVTEPGKAPTTDVLHVIGRTFSSPRVYFYRKRVKLAAGVAEAPLWTPWEKIDLDIEGDHILPIVHEGRLRLLWPLFNQKSVSRTVENAPMQKLIDALQKANDKLPVGLALKKIQQDVIDNLKRQLNDDTQAIPIDYFEIKLAWSEYKSGRWAPRKVASQSVSSQAIEIGVLDPPDASRYVFHAETQGDEVVVCCMLPMFRPTGENFTGNKKKSMAAGEFHLSGCAGQDTALDMSFVTDEIIAHTYAALTNMTVANNNLLWAEVGELPAKATLNELLAKRDRRALLSSSPNGPIFSLIPHQLPQLDARHTPFAVHDTKRSFVVSSTQGILPRHGGDGVSYHFHFERFTHPFSCAFIQSLNRGGVDGLLRWGPTPKNDPASPTHLLPDHVQWQSTNTFASYHPTINVGTPLPIDEVDTASDGAYAVYNREIFFHAPFLVADRLSKNQRFEEAQQWFHYIFDPTDGSKLAAPARYWKYRPFYEEADRMSAGSLESLLSLLGGKTPEAKKARATLEHEVSAWRHDPFNPHRIARLRPAAYPKNVVMRYIQNLIDWGDQLFRRDTLETLNEATLLYVLASDILGPRPVLLPERPTTPTTYVELQANLNPPNVLRELEGMIPAPVSTSTGPDEGLNALLGLGLSGFCVPPNEMLLGFWDTVADRLFKIRNCMNIEGVVRELPLFEPPIDPALLVRAAAAGLDLGTTLADLNAPTPLYRFQTLLGRASELCGDVRALGAALLSALEKLDAEAVSRLRSSHELQLLDAVRDVKSQQIREAERSLDGLQKAREVVEIRHEFYRTAVFINPSEQQALILSGVASELQLMSQTVSAGAAAVYPVPDVSTGMTGLSPTAIAEIAGGKKSAAAMQAFGQAMGIYASLLGSNASMSATLGGYQRRADDWKREEQALAKELQQMDKQILGAEIRLAIAEKELENHDLQRENAREADALLHDKFTNEELYDWMVGELSAVHFQSYRLAWDAARRAERAFQLELGDSKSSFLQPGAWDSLRKGLLAGEKLQHDLRRMEMAYLDQNRRELEITKHISLAQIDPLALIRLRETGTCDINLLEALFDHDFPGNYTRRIKTVSLTVPCVTGQYTGLNAKLTLTNSTIRTSTDLVDGYGRKPEGEDKRFSDSNGSPESIVTSNGQADSGLFEANLHDERYLPFEGKGAISTWHLEINRATNAFDLATISDVVLHLRYTARDGGDLLKNAATTAVLTNLPSTALALIDVRAQFPDAWHRFLHPTANEANAVLTLSLAEDVLPFLQGKAALQITEVDVLSRWSRTVIGGTTLPLVLAAPGVTPPATNVAANANLVSNASVGGLGKATLSSLNASPGTWTLTLRASDLAGLTGLIDILQDGTARLKPDVLDGIWLLLHVQRSMS
jgi:Tc toxin complex TcA C-terminal TcB-binding domain/Neuraminidase-like domain